MSKRNGGGAIRTLLVAASAVRRAGLEALIEASPGLKLVGSLQSADSLRQHVRDLQPDVVVVDLDQGNRSAVLDPGIGGMPLVILVDDPDPVWGAQALRSGVRAILPRDVDSDEILSAIQAVLRGLVLLDSELATELAIQIRQPAAMPEVALEALTPRELEVLRMLAEGLGNRQMAAHLGISDHTVKFHISSILDKLGAATRTEAVTMGIRMGLILL
jgi:NarL family two-component system response regulator YdfI